MPRFAVLLCFLLLAAPAIAQKKVLRIHTAGPNDTNVDNTKLAVEFQDRSNAAQNTIEVKVFVAAINSMGANATPMNFGEIYTSLQSGVLDGFEHTAATVISFKMNEVACCIALTKHLMDPTFLVFSLAEWKKLSPAEQSALQKAATDAAMVVRQMAPQREGEALAQVKKLGMKVNEIDTAPLVKSALQAQDELAKEFGAEKLLAQIRAQQ